MGNKLKALWDKLNQDWKDIWNQDKAFFFLFGIVILFIKFRDIIISLMLSSAKREFDTAQKQDIVLSKQENKAKIESEVLVQQAQDLPLTKKPVTEDWNQPK